MIGHNMIPSAVGCVIVQQYSSATFSSLRFYLRKEKVGAFQKCIISISSPFFVTLLKKCVSFELRHK
jgi:hypothetical protein